jgi:hypothetical protein
VVVPGTSGENNTRGMAYLLTGTPFCFFLIDRGLGCGRGCGDGFREDNKKEGQERWSKRNGKGRRRIDKGF